MERIKFTTLDLKYLTNEDVSALVGKTIENATNLASGLGTVSNAILVVLKPLHDAFAAQLNRLRKSPLTELINSQRDKCEDLFAEIKRTVAFHGKSREASKQAAAVKMDYFLAPYKNLNKKANATQQELTDELIAKFANNQEIIDAATALDINDLFIQLKADNTELKQLFDQRNLEVGSRTEASTDLRAPAVDTYRDFCISVEQALTYTPNQDLKDLYAQMEELRKKYHALIPKEEILTDDEADEVDTEM